MEIPLPTNSHNAESLPPPDSKPAATRRPKVRHVSSRFMTPVVSRTPSANRRHPDGDPLTCADPNRTDVVRRADSPFPSHVQAKPAPSTNRRRVAVKLFKENGGQAQVVELPRPADDTAADPKALNLKLPLPGRGRPRFDTPVVGSRANSAGQNRSKPALPSANSAAWKLLQSISANSTKNTEIPEQSHDLIGSEESATDNFTDDEFADSETCSISSTCDSPPIPAQKQRGTPDVRSSMPENARVSARYVGEGGQVSGDQCRVAASPCYRSLNSALSTCQQSLNHSKAVNKSAVFPNSSKLGSSKMGSVCLLPPHPAQSKPGVAEAKKGKCSSSHVEDVHALKLLYNRYLQWRFANAKAETSLNIQKLAAEKSLYTVMEKVSNKQEVVLEKRRQLAQLKRTQTLYTILDSQMPHLDDWSFLESDYLASLSGIITALLDTASRLPVAGDIRVDIGELADVFQSMSSIMNAICLSIECFTPMASGLNNVLSNLAEVVSDEKAVIEECNDFVSNAHMLQVEECSLRGQLIQLKGTMGKIGQTPINTQLKEVAHS